MDRTIEQILCFGGNKNQQVVGVVILFELELYFKLLM